MIQQNNILPQFYVIFLFLFFLSVCIGASVLVRGYGAHHGRGDAGENSDLTGSQSASQELALFDYMREGSVARAEQQREGAGGRLMSGVQASANIAVGLAGRTRRYARGGRQDARADRGQETPSGVLQADAAAGLCDHRQLI